MPAFGQIAKPAALIVAAATFLSIPGTARAETGWLWFDSVFSVPRAAPASTNRQPVAPIKRTKLAQPVVAPAPAPRPVLVSTPRPILVSTTAPEVRPNCFWCGRPVYVSGLSF